MNWEAYCWRRNGMTIWNITEKAKLPIMPHFQLGQKWFRTGVKLFELCKLPVLFSKIGRYFSLKPNFIMMSHLDNVACNASGNQLGCLLMLAVSYSCSIGLSRMMLCHWKSLSRILLDPEAASRCYALWEIFERGSRSSKEKKRYESYGEDDRIDLAFSEFQNNSPLST